MFVVLGATGHIGSAVADALLDAGEDVTVVTRTPAKAEHWRARGAAIAEADIDDLPSLRAAFRLGRRAFLLNPPAPPSTDTDAEERRTGSAIVAALEGSGLEAVVALSTYGAQPGDAIGDLGTLHAFEEALRRQPIPVRILRSAYLMSNWDALLPAAREGHLPTMLLRDAELPMVAPADVGRAAADLLRGETSPVAPIHFVEGPERYAPDDVAVAFSQALGRSVAVDVVPRESWEQAFLDLGFSAPAARSYARMTGLTVDGRVELPTHPERGATTLRDYVREIVEGNSG